MIIDGQQPGGGFDYEYRRGDAPETRETERGLERFAYRGRLPDWGVSHSGGEHGGETLSRNQSRDGHWDCFTYKGRKHGPVYNTTLAALGLMFYRNNRLPTAGHPVENSRGPGPDDSLAFGI